MGAPSGSSRRKPNIKAAIKGARLAETTVQVCLRGDLANEVGELESRRDVLLAQHRQSDSMAGPGEEVADLEAQLEKLRGEQRQHTFPFTFREMTYRRWDKLQTSHPPRKGHQEHVNPETFFPELIRASLVAPVLDDESWGDLLGVEVEHEGPCKLDSAGGDDNDACVCRDPVLSKSQFGMLCDAAYLLNSNKDQNVPFSQVASLLRQLSGSA